MGKQCIGNSQKPNQNTFASKIMDCFSLPAVQAQGAVMDVTPVILLSSFIGQENPVEIILMIVITIVIIIKI